VNANRQAKEAEVVVLKDRFARATSTVLLDFRGIDVETVTSLRVAFRKAGVEYRVAKNTLVKKALKGTNLEGNAKLNGFLRGPTGLAFSYEDPTAAAKVIKEFRKGGEKQEKVGIKCGVLETLIFEGDKVESQLATMPGKNEVRAQLLATLLAPAQTLVRLLNAPAQNLTLALAAQERKLGGK
jgi:large subunit ribosomal protein L10